MTFKKTGVAVKIIILVIVVYAVASLVSLSAQLSSSREALAGLKAESEAQELGNKQLRETIAAYGDESVIESIARDDLGLVDYDEMIFYDVSK